MKVTLIDYTGKGNPNPDYALDLLLFTKSTRLQMSPSLLEEISKKSREEKYEELGKMADTIPSSWEFVDLTFMIEGVTRAFTHQLVRSRHASFAQQTMRVLNVSDGPGWDYLTGPSIEATRGDGNVGTPAYWYDHEMKMIALTYKELLAAGVKIEDARGILPTNILTNIVMKCNMRTFVEMVRKRSSYRVQGEYRDVLVMMQVEVLSALPWVAIFINRDADQAAARMRDAINEHFDGFMAIDLHKLVDRMMGA